MNFIAKFKKKLFNWINPIKGQEDVDNFYKELKYPAMLTQALKKAGFSRVDMGHFDWVKTPQESLSSKSKIIHSGDYTSLYVELYKRLGLDYNIYLLDSPERWFWQRESCYVSVITWKGKKLMQANNTLSYIDSEDNLLDVFDNCEFTRVVKLENAW